MVGRLSGVKAQEAAEVVNNLKRLFKAIQEHSKAIFRRRALRPAGVGRYDPRRDPELSLGEPLNGYSRIDRRSPESSIVSKRRRIRRVVDPFDGRGIRLSLTPLGRRLLNEARPPFQVGLRTALEDLPSSQLRQLRRGLEQVVKERPRAASPPRSSTSRLRFRGGVGQRGEDENREGGSTRPRGRSKLTDRGLPALAAQAVEAGVGERERRTTSAAGIRSVASGTRPNLRRLLHQGSGFLLQPATATLRTSVALASPASLLCARDRSRWSSGSPSAPPRSRLPRARRRSTGRLRAPVAQPIDPVAGPPPTMRRSIFETFPCSRRPRRRALCGAR